MANPQHIEWLLDGVEAWNKRRDQQGFTPDLEHVNLHREGFAHKAPPAHKPVILHTNFPNSQRPTE